MYPEKLKYLRERKGLTITDVANKVLNIDRSQYGHYENDYITIPIKHLIKLCNYYDVSLDYIFDFTNIKTYQNMKKEPDKKVAGERLKNFRKERKLTQTKLATLLNTTFTTISSYERGVNLISTNYLYTICKKYKISADYLLGRIDK